MNTETTTYTPAEATNNGVNYGNEKEITRAGSVVAFDPAEGRIREVIVYRVYMGRSRSATKVHATVWVHGAGSAYSSGSGSAGGGGYCKSSAALAVAAKNAGIKSADSFAGAGVERAERVLVEAAKQAYPGLVGYSTISHA
mgnify:CR=1 FL=1